MLKTDYKAAKSFQLQQQTSVQGATVYSLGNPHDLGLIVVPGTYNGLQKHSFYPRIHFTGAVNAGMSGGPTVDAAGKVVGVLCLEHIGPKRQWHSDEEAFVSAIAAVMAQTLSVSAPPPPVPSFLFPVPSLSAVIFRPYKLPACPAALLTSAAYP